MRVVLDSNVYIRALQPNAYPLEAEVLMLWLEREKYTLLTSEAQIEEIRRVSRRKVAIERIGRTKFGILINKMRERAVVLEPKSVPYVVPADPSDDFILVIALEGKAQLLVSDDKHLKSLKKVGKTAILTPAEALKKLRRL